MNLVPYAKWSIHTDLPLESVVATAQAQVEKRSFWGSIKGAKRPFVGTVDRQGFRIVPSRRWYEHSSANVAVGRFVQAPAGVRIDVTFRVQWFLPLALGLLVLLFGLGLLSERNGSATTPGTWLGPALLAAFVYATTLARFLREEGAAREAIRTWFGAHERHPEGFDRPRPIG